MKKYLLIIILVFIFLFSLAGNTQAQEKNYPTIVQSYPELPACENNANCKPGQAGFGLPQFIKYIFIFSLGAVGLIGFTAVILAGFSYTTSAGNPQKAAHAKDQMLSALLGMLLLLGSYVILNMVNPDLLKLKVDVPALEVKIPNGNGDNGNGDNGNGEEGEGWACYCCQKKSLLLECKPFKEGVGERLFCRTDLTRSKTKKLCKKQCVPEKSEVGVTTRIREEMCD